jgi:integrase
MSRARGTGSLFRKTYKRNGRTYREPTWTIQFYANGRRVREATGQRDKQAAQRALNKKLYQVDRDEYQRTEPIRCEALFAALREHYLNDRRTETAARLGWQWQRHLAPRFSHVLVTRITTDAVTRYVGERREEGAANATINRELAALRRMFNLGKRSTPPKVREVPYIPLLRESNVRTGFVEDPDFSRLAAEASELWLRTFLELAYTYGWRKGELLGLRVRQLDLTAGKIRLDPGTTKNGEGREVEMTAKVAQLLRQAVSGKGPEDYVLAREVKQGRRIVYTPVVSMRDAWQNLCVRAGLGAWVCCNCESVVTKRKKCECGSRKREYRGRIPHDLRRSAAKAARRAGMAESVIMATGGWKTPAMFRRYAIVSSSDQRAFVEALEKSRAAENSPAFGPARGSEATLAALPTHAKPQ